MALAPSSGFIESEGSFATARALAVLAWFSGAVLVGVAGMGAVFDNLMMGLVRCYYTDSAMVGVCMAGINVRRLYVVSISRD